MILKLAAAQIRAVIERHLPVHDRPAARGIVIIQPYGNRIAGGRIGRIADHGKRPDFLTGNNIFKGGRKVGACDGEKDQTGRGNPFR